MNIAMATILRNIVVIYLMGYIGMVTASWVRSNISNELGHFSQTVVAVVSRGRAAARSWDRCGFSVLAGPVCLCYLVCVVGVCLLFFLHRQRCAADQ